MWPSTVGRYQTSFAGLGVAGLDAPTMPNSPPEMPVITMPLTISGAAVLE